MKTGALWLIEVPDGGLFTIGVPLMAGTWSPTIEAGFVLPLVVLASHYHCVFYPDAALGNFETSFPKRGTEVLTFAVGVEDVVGTARLEDGKHDGEHLLEEGGEEVIFHRVILDGEFVFSAAFIVDVVGRIGDA